MRPFRTTGLAALASLCLAAGGRAEEPDAVRLRLAHELLTASGQADQTRQLFAASLDASEKAMTANLDPKLRSAVEASSARTQERLLALLDAVRAESEHVYAETLTEEELRDAIAWNESASGRSVRRKLPEMMRRVMAAEAPELRRFALDLARDQVRSACAERNCTSQELAAALAKIEALFGQSRS